MPAKFVRLRRRSRVQPVNRFALVPDLFTERGTAKQTALQFLRDWAPKLKLDLALTPLSYDRTLVSRTGSHVLFQQTFRRRRVGQAWLRVDLDRDGHVVGYSHRCLTGANARRSDRACPARPAVGGRAAIAAAVQARADLTGASAVGRPQVVYVKVGPSFRLCWKVGLAAAGPADRWRVYVDAATAAPVRVEAGVYRAAGSGLVFAPNPMVALNAPALSPAAAVPPTAYRQVPLPELDGSGFLNGPWATTAATTGVARIRRPSGDFRVTREQPGFREVMAYYHIDATQRYLQSVGLTHAPAAVSVNVNGSLVHGSSYDPETGVITLSVGGTADAEDAEVIVHEYAHAVQNAIVFGFGQDDSSAPVAEGFADYLAATGFDGVKGDAFRPGLASWEAAGEGSPGSPPFERRLDFQGPFNPALDRKQLTQLWSGSLWALRRLFGRTRGDILAVGFLSFVPAHDANLADAALAVRAVNQQLYQGDGDADILALFATRGIDARSD